MKIDLNELFEAQKQLDSRIAENHNVTYESTRDRRTLSLLVELGELANSTRCFKYWSNKGSEPLERVLDEYADALHFFLSLGIDIGTSKKVYNRTKVVGDLTKQILEVYKRVNKFVEKRNDANFIKAFQSFLNIIPLLNVRWKTVENAYFKKLGENYHRQDSNY
ncbi:MAG: dUTP diphosphatase [Bacilli bacterium]|nr:dUTP diphosphatase [Bacilli bacterium]